MGWYPLLSFDRFFYDAGMGERQPRSHRRAVPRGEQGQGGLPTFSDNRAVERYSHLSSETIVPPGELAHINQAAEAIRLGVERGTHDIFVANQPPSDGGLLAAATPADIPLPPRTD
jgi:hypothetical protein